MMIWQNTGIEDELEEKSVPESTWLERQYEIEEMNKQIESINNYYDQTRETPGGWWWSFPWEWVK